MNQAFLILRPVWLIIAFLPFPFLSFSQTVLEADGPGNTYELINRIFAPGYIALETPDCVHPDYGRHIAEVWDDELNQFVFEFYIHVTPDNDRCLNFDRQRVEIKTYESSPTNLKGTPGETVIYKWKFRIPKGFQPSSSFTHIHQVKAVDGDDGNPLFTLTPRAGSPNKLQLIHDNTAKVASVSLSLFEGIWVEATEKIKIDSQHGTYSMVIKKVSDGTTLLSFSNNDIMTIRATNTFIRPKWGIYRSLTNMADLRDESMRFAGFSIAEGEPTSVDIMQGKEIAGFHVLPNPVCQSAEVVYILNKRTTLNLELVDLDGKVNKVLIRNEIQIPGNYQKTIDVSDVQAGLYFVCLTTDNCKQIFKLSVKK